MQPRTVLRLRTTFSQIADGGDLEPQMFGLTTKNYKMQKSSINNENPAIGNVLLAEGFVISKAYEIDLDKLDEGYLSDSIICHAENLNKAKTELLKKIRYDDWKLKYSGEELNYLNIPVKRRKSSDKVIFEGKEVVRSSIDGLIAERDG